jgi:hypothetical protein
LLFVKLFFFVRFIILDKRKKELETNGPRVDGKCKTGNRPKTFDIDLWRGQRLLCPLSILLWASSKKKKKKRQVDTKYVSEMPKEFIFIYLFVECIADAASKFWYLFCDIYTADRKESILGSQMNGRARV